MNEDTPANEVLQRLEALLDALDEKLQLGLLDHLKRSNSYSIEDDTLFVTPANETDEQYLRKHETIHHLLLIAEDSIGIKAVIIRPSTS